MSPARRIAMNARTSVASSAPADPLAAAANITTSTATWTTTGLTTPVKQKIAITFTPQMKGYFRIVFKVAKAKAHHKAVKAKADAASTPAPVVTK